MSQVTTSRSSRISRFGGLRSGSWDSQGCVTKSASRALVASVLPLHVRLEDPRLVGEHDCLDAVPEVELLEDVRDMCLDRRFADVELLRDLPVRKTARSRSLRSPSSFGGAGRGIRANFWITRLVIVGERSASPASTVRIAAISCSGESSLRTKPLAPAL